jgi:hypothetical protein
MTITIARQELSTPVSPCPAQLMPIRFGRAVCGDLTEAERREWWLANGLGGYAAGTVAGNLTRRYHGLLTAPVDPPLGRRLVFAKADATLIADGREWSLFTNRWADDTVAPAGYSALKASISTGAFRYGFSPPAASASKQWSGWNRAPTPFIPLGAYWPIRRYPGRSNCE